MFQPQLELAHECRKHGRKIAVELLGDIHEYTKLYGPKEQADVPYLNARQLFDFNEHFIEWGGPTGDRTVVSMVLLPVLMLLLPVGCYLAPSVLYDTIFAWRDGAGWSGLGQGWAIFAGMFLMLGVWSVAGISWYFLLRAHLFTALCPRYRFNRTTRKVYVLRPRQFGGNVILDWDRVLAHPNWCAAPDNVFHPGFQHDPALREARISGKGGVMMKYGLVLYWPPLDAEDPERTGEELLWVGQWHSSISDWEYIRRFMEEGMDAVPKPEASHYRRKGRSSMRQYYWEEEMDPELRQAELLGEPDPRAKLNWLQRLLPAPFLIFNTLGQWLCYWPTFPEEWNSDCGRTRRESGIGPEEPLRWTPEKCNASRTRISF